MHVPCWRSGNKTILFTHLAFSCRTCGLVTYVPILDFCAGTALEQDCVNSIRFGPRGGADGHETTVQHANLHTHSMEDSENCVISGNESGLANLTPAMARATQEMGHTINYQ